MKGGGHRLKDMTGERINRLVVLSRATPTKQGQARWLCKCDCGNEAVISGSRLRKGQLSCGCARLENPQSVTHGLTDTPTYRSWRAMKKRCTNQNHPAYARYGGAGVSICERWLHSFENFLEDMGERPDGRTLERIDNARGYEPSNCKWATRTEQSRNRRVTVLTIELADEIRRSHATGENQASIARRLGLKRHNVGDVINGGRWKDTA